MRSGREGAGWYTVQQHPLPDMCVLLCQVGGGGGEQYGRPIENVQVMDGVKQGG